MAVEIKQSITCLCAFYVMEYPGHRLKAEAVGDKATQCT